MEKTKARIKAEELVDRFRPQCYCYVGSGMLTNDFDAHEQIRNAKTCALILVNEILDEYGIQIKHRGIDNPTIDNNIGFWLEVKSELEKA